jgi:hypothetical protein
MIGLVECKNVKAKQTLIQQDEKPDDFSNSKFGNQL